MVVKNTHGKFDYYYKHARFLMVIAYLIMDLICLLFVSVGAVIFWSYFKSALIPLNYIPLLPFLLLFLLYYAVSGLYSLHHNAVDELKKLTLTTTIAFLTLGFLTFWLRTPELYSRLSFVLAWLLALIVLPIGRALLREMGSRMDMWGEPVAIFGYGENSLKIIRFLQSNPKLGLIPMVMVSDKKTNKIIIDFELQVLNLSKLREEPLPKIFEYTKTAIIIPGEISTQLLKSITDKQYLKLKRLIMVTENFHSVNVTVEPYDFGGLLGLDLHQNLLSRVHQIIKRSLDITIVLIASPILIPTFIGLSILIMLDSKGPVFFKHKRIGHDGKIIGVWKFRTMVVRADQILNEYLTENPELMIEWRDTQKLKNDPRITPVGKFLRKMSLDELPQLWNVLIGEMSLVGPRPIVKDEIANYKEKINLYYQVKPGLTGLWQVSGRNNLSYEHRVKLDEYYVRSWSIWLDFYILIKTIYVVIKGNGAY